MICKSENNKQVLKEVDIYLQPTIKPQVKIIYLAEFLIEAPRTYERLETLLNKNQKEFV